MLTLDNIREILGNVKYKDWTFLTGLNGGTPYLQILFTADGEIQHCRKWQLSVHMVPSEIVRTAWKAVLAAEEHEAAEQFKYKGAMIYNPHFDLDAMVEFAKGGNLTARAMTDNQMNILVGNENIVLTRNGDGTFSAVAV